MVDQTQKQNYVGSIHLIEEYPRINSQNQIFQSNWYPSHDLCQPSFTRQPVQYSHSHHAYQRSPNHSQKFRLKQRTNQRQRSRPRQSPNSNRSNRTSDPMSQIQLTSTYTTPMDVSFMIDYLQKTNYHENTELFLHENGYDLNVQSSFHPQNANNFMFNNYQSLHNHQPLPNFDSNISHDMLGYNQIGTPPNVNLNMMENQINPTVTTTLDYVQINNCANAVPMNTDFLLYPPNNYVFPDVPLTDSSQIILPNYQQTHFLV
ncbi:4282_t:CDS:1 [Dentiscutata heterogama]|uniref:4282_t:CDS:1 n=1 Tax=Dentiscutata heterogama TaxID=1316150 RepID=A0ACA9K2T4_9GLOM|nr:4282_t:CDS:1 [Dentiscutata heterogama]